MNLISRARSVPYQPFLFALFIGISIYSPNRTYYSFSVILLPLAVIFGIIGVALIISRFVRVDFNKTQIFLSCALILNYTYFIFRNDTITLTFWPYLSLITAIYVLLFLLLITVVWRMSSSRAGKLCHVLNILAVAVVLIGMANLALFMLSEASDANDSDQNPEFEAQFQKYLKENLTSQLSDRDFYFIILDRYPGEDTLYAEYGFNNSNFYKNLTNMDFRCEGAHSKSNYGLTTRSIASMLNMDYYDQAKREGYNEENNRLWRFFKSQGYRFVYLESNWPTTGHNANADISLNPFYIPLGDPQFSSYDAFQRIMFFERSFIGNLYYQLEFRMFGKAGPLSITNFEWVVNHPEANWDARLKSNEGVVRSHVLNSFDNLTKVPQIQGKKIVISHIDRWITIGNGSYADSLQELNLLTESVLAEIIRKSEHKPVIILMSDHGTKPQARAIKENFSTFEKYACYPNQSLAQEYIGSCWYDVNNIEAFYLPECNNSSLMYPGITPINVWRNVLNYYFGTNFPQVEDESYWYSPDGGICKIEQQPAPR